ncbi:sodium:alanine symporter family protein [Ensifer sp. LCM 4579]|uniref:alanine/glycine:cation symporter family protein n=1 Tax=Ensifer sp. LCM 4579 TaxID=1848292 RepID=UPI0008D96695|nr:alanine/glycine:cation symporter family protein [Ensifer sp. LCM 4579]OHV83346.1 sodium:alanine symporter [Ensifer sp. LCM 4579]
MLDFLNDLLWSKVLIVVLIGLGLWFTFASRFVQLRYFGRMFRILGSGQVFASGSDGHLSSFQALMLSVAGRVGGGNIAGVAVAITLGGPGAVFWMWVVGLIGMATSFFECTLAQAYKRAEPDGTYRGGPAYYIAHGLGERWKWLAGLYSVLLLVTFGFGFNGVQSYAVATSLNDAFGVPVMAIGVGLAVLVGIIIAGGVRRIARIADVLVPAMALGYIAMALVVLALNFDAVPATLMLIVKSAFGLEPAVGGGIGAAIVMGVRRGLFSNEAGLGSAPNVAAVAEVPHPASQGVVQAFSVFIDTLIVCSCTAFIILLGDVYRPGAEEVGGIALAQASLAGHIGEGGRVFVSIAMMLFGFTTMIYNYYLGENSLAWLGGQNRPLIIVYRIAVIGLCGWGATSDLGTIFAFADVTMGLLALVNLFALVMLFKPALKLMQDYDSQLAKNAGEPVFDPEKFGYAGIDRNAWSGTVWGEEPEAVAAGGSARA